MPKTRKYLYEKLSSADATAAMRGIKKDTTENFIFVLRRKSADPRENGLKNVEIKTTFINNIENQASSNARQCNEHFVRALLIKEKR